MKEGKILPVSDSVKWIGVLDFDIVTFDVVMTTDFGTTYNSYFIDAQKKTIVETAKEKFSDIYLEKIKKCVNPLEIDYIILNHTEPDHSGSLEKLLQIAPNATVVGTGNAIKYISDMMSVPFKYKIVKGGETLDLGNKTIEFISAPNLHWPDSMYSYLKEDKILFSCDSFGAHFCDEAMFNDLVGDYASAFNYYFDVILKPFSRFMVKAINRIRDLEIDVICPGHGPILRENPWSIVNKSEELANEYLSKIDPCDKKVLICYVSAYGYTKLLAQNIEKGIQKFSHLKTELVDIENISLGDLDMKISQSGALLIGCPTVNQNILLPVYKLFAVINPIRDKGKIASAFGSYGWSGEAVSIIEANLKVLKLKVIEQGLSFKFNSALKNEDEIVNYGYEFAQEIVNLIEQ